MSSVMALWARRLATLMLTVFLAAGSSVTAVQASSMMVKMSQTSDAAMTGHSDCPHCRDMGSSKNKVMGFTIACVASVFVMNADGKAILVAVPVNIKRPLPMDELPLAGISPPVPHPPPSAYLS